MEMVKVLNAFFTPVLMSKTVLQESQAPETCEKVRSNGDLLLVEDAHIKKHLNKLDIQMSMESDGMNP